MADMIPPGKALVKNRIFRQTIPGNESPGKAIHEHML